jgi:uncharacterized protein YndB with AHSA1/START domain
MTKLATVDAYGELIEPATLKIERLLPGPIERVWAYLTESDLRRQWLASGRMELRVGAPFQLTWRNDELTDPPGERPAGMRGEHSIESRILAVDPPRKLAFTFAEHGEVSIDLVAQGDQVLLTLIHRRAPSRSTLISVSAGWHAHLDQLVARMSGKKTGPFWDQMSKLRAEYDRRIPA